MDHVFFNRPIDHQSTSNDRLKPVLTTGLVNMHIDRSIANLVAIYFRRDQVIYFDSYGRPPEEQYVLPFLERNSTRWIHNKEWLQTPWSKVCGMWCIYITHQLNKGLDLNTAIHQELYVTGEDLYQNDRDIGMWFSYNYARLILSQKGMRRMTPPDFLFKHRIQTCKCHNYSHHLSKKYPKYNML